MKHLLSIDDLAVGQVHELFDTAKELATITSGQNKKLPTLRGKTIVNLFFEDSTRTRLSFEAAAKKLSADVINFSAKGSSVSKGESLKDTAQTIEAIGADLMIVRHAASGAPRILAESGWVQAQIVNAGDGTAGHPTQALLDSYTISQRLTSGGYDFNGLRVAIVGDILHSRVARSNTALLTKLGAHVTLVGPPTLIPLGAPSWGADICYGLDDVVPTSDVIMMLRVQSERMKNSYFPSEREYARDYGLSKKRLSAMKSGAIIMHPGPMNRGLEISGAAADSPASVVLEQVRHGVYVRMAVLLTLLSGARDGIQA